MNKKNMVQLIDELESLEKIKCNLPLVFAQIFKDEINATDESNIYSGIKAFIGKYEEENMGLMAVDEFFKIICGGASLQEVMQVTIDEVKTPSIETALLVDDSCEIEVK